MVIAALYSTVGHGGASGYIAVLAIAGYHSGNFRQDVLILNILVSAIAFIQFYRNGYFQCWLFLPLIIGSVPMAYLGGRMHIDVHLYSKILGALLLIPAILFLFNFKNKEAIKPMPWYLGVVIGMVLGFVSGLTGIGGGVFLSPILILAAWAGQKQTAAISAPFILVNSIAGLMGTLGSGHQFDSNVIGFAITVVVGGFIGSGLGARRFNNLVLKRMLAVVLFIACYKLLELNFLSKLALSL